MNEQENKTVAELQEQVTKVKETADMWYKMYAQEKARADRYKTVLVSLLDGKVEDL